MPLHDFRCNKGHTFEEVVSHGTDVLMCRGCEATGWANPAYKVFLTPPVGFVQRDICYDSPVDGRPITTKAARLDDLRRNDCVEYEPGMRQDAERRKRESEAQLDRAVDSSVDQFIASAPVRKVEKLEQELRAGAAVEVTRASPALTN